MRKLSYPYLDNSNITYTHLSNKGLHLNHHGTKIMASNIISLIKRLLPLDLSKQITKGTITSRIKQNSANSITPLDMGGDIYQCNFLLASDNMVLSASSTLSSSNRSPSNLNHHFHIVEKIVNPNHHV